MNGNLPVGLILARAATVAPWCSTGLIAWAQAHGRNLADAFVRDDIEGRGDPAAFISAACDKSRLLGILREHAEPAFRERIAELESGHG
jgi:hypothetical protein